MKKDIPYYTNQNETVTTTLISDKADFRAKKITRDKVGHYVMIKVLILQQDITYFNVYMPNNRTTKYVRQNLIELQEEIDEHTVLVGHSNSPLPVNDRQLTTPSAVKAVEQQELLSLLVKMQMVQLL